MFFWKYPLPEAIPELIRKKEDAVLTVEKLKTFGADTNEGLDRCMKNEAFYLRLVNMVLKDDTFGKLDASLEGGDFAAAFEAAHALKGTLGNLSLTPLYAPVSTLTERLRPKEPVEYADLLEEIRKQKKILEEMAAD